MNLQDSRDRFKKYLRKIGSGEETGRNLNRKEASDALNLMLLQKPTAAQIGAFMIAHRIRRPEPEELAGMVDTYIKLGPQIISETNQRTPICFGMPFDGRNRLSPIYPLTTLILISKGQPIVLNSGGRMPVKYGVTAEELFTTLGLTLKGLTIKEVQRCFSENNLAVIYQPDHFPLADSLIPYRDEIGKRPPLASMELIWTAHQGKHLLITGFVHRPTESKHWKAMQLLGEEDLITVNGLEGSTDLSVSKICALTRVKNDVPNYFALDARQYGINNKDAKWLDLKNWRNDAFEALANKGPLKDALHWNAGVYLWIAGISRNIHDGISQAETILSSGIAMQTLEKLIKWRIKL